MTNKEILQKVIEKAECNGFRIINKQPSKLCWFQEGFVVEDLTQNDIIFSHEFAKAFWGEDKSHCTNCDNIVEPLPKSGYCEKCKCPFEYTEDIIKGWKYHLQQMILEKDPIKYLEKFL